MKTKILIYGFIFIIFTMTSCSNHKIAKQTNPYSQSEVNENMENLDKMIQVTINEKNYYATLEQNATAKAFFNLLPQQFTLTELNGNEKYIYMDYNLPTNPYNPKHIEKGDIMLYGNNCLVLFYESFDTIYSYTKIGYIENLPDLGNGNVTVTFSK